MSGQQWSTDAANQVDPYVLAHNPNATPAMMALAQQKFPNGLPSDGMDMSNVNQANPTQIQQTAAHPGLIGDPSYKLPGGAGYAQLELASFGGIWAERQRRNGEWLRRPYSGSA